MRLVICDTCEQSFPVDSFPPVGISRCFHTHCWPCFKAYVLTHSGLTSIPCPSPGCAGAFTFRAFLAATGDHRRKFQRLKLCDLCNLERPESDFSDSQASACESCLRAPVECVIFPTEYLSEPNGWMQTP